MPGFGRCPAERALCHLPQTCIALHSHESNGHSLVHRASAACCICCYFHGSELILHRSTQRAQTTIPNYTDRKSLFADGCYLRSLIQSHAPQAAANPHYQTDRSPCMDLHSAKEPINTEHIYLALQCLNLMRKVAFVRRLLRCMMQEHLVPQIRGTAMGKVDDRHTRTLLLDEGQSVCKQVQQRQIANRAGLSQCRHNLHSSRWQVTSRDAAPSCQPRHTCCTQGAANRPQSSGVRQWAHDLTEN